MTASSTIEMRVRDRAASSAPEDAAEKVLGVAPSAGSEERFASAVHWTYGIGWGAARGVLAALGFKGPTATLLHFTVVWGSALVMLPKLDVAPPVREWGVPELAIDAMHHGVYAAATAVAYRMLAGGTDQQR
jgi:hypothetical protein